MTAHIHHQSARLAAALALILTLLLPGGTALAAPATRSTEHSVNVMTSTGAEDAFVFASLTVIEGDGSGADVQIWLPPDRSHLDPPTLVSGSDDLALGPMDSLLTGSVELIDNVSGEPAGVAVVDATLAPLGDPEVSTITAAGNQKLRRTQVVQPLSVSGTITVPGGNGPVAIPLDGSQATAMDREEFANAPASTILPIEVTGLLNWWEAGGVLIGLAAESEGAWSYVEVAVILPEGTVLNGTLEGARFDTRRIDADFALTASGEGVAATGGSASVHGDVSITDRQRSVMVDGDDRLQATIEQLRASGTLNVSLDDGRSFSLPLEQISGSFYSYREMFRDGGRAG